MLCQRKLFSFPVSFAQMPQPSVRSLRPAYMDAYERTINETASKHAPWYVIPADQKWVARLLVSQAVLKTLKDIDPHYPEMPADQRENLAACREQLISE